MFKKIKSKAPLIFIIFACIITLAINFPKTEINKKIGFIKLNYLGDYGFSIFGNPHSDLNLKRGLDISGGVRVTLVPSLDGIEEDQKTNALDSLKSIIENRVNRFGVNEPNVLLTNFNGNHRVIVEIPGIADADRALELIGKTAKLGFKLEEGEIEIQEGFSVPDFKDVSLQSEDIKKSTVELFTGQNGAANEPSVKLTFTNEGGKKFADITKDNIGKRLAIYLDDQILIAPVIQDQILSGEAYITGQFTLEEANDISIQINSGALPVPVSISQQERVGPSVGAIAVYNSILGGIIGLLLVMLFMLFNYKKLGVISILSLIVYGLLTISLYKIIPVTITLPGIAGLILSIGMAVDSNILIFESVKEQKRLGLSDYLAAEKGFANAWNSIKDANIVGLIISFVLFNPFDWGFLLTSGPVRGFAATLGIGILVSLFTGVFITKYFLQVVYKK